MTTTRRIGRAPEMEVAIGARLRLERTSRGMSQEKLAEAIGVTFQQIHKYENGTNRIAVSTLWKIADALSVPWVDFMPSEQEVSATSDVNRPSPALITKGTNIAIALAKLDPKISASIEKHIELLAAAA